MAKTIDQLRSHLDQGPRPRGLHKNYRKQAVRWRQISDKPAVKILSSTWSTNTRHAHFPQRTEDVKRGVWQAGGFPAVAPL